jgi:serine/threonine protein kinase
VLDGLAGLHRSTDADGSSMDASVEETTDRIPGAALGERSDVWGRHRLLQKIGEGSFGSVYRAWDPSSNGRSRSRSSTSASPPAR